MIKCKKRWMSHWQSGKGCRDESHVIASRRSPWHRPPGRVCTLAAKSKNALAMTKTDIGGVGRVAGVIRKYNYHKRQTMRKNFVERRGRLQDMDRSFDLKFWQAQSPKVRSDVVWEMIVHVMKVKGHDVRQLRLQRSITNFQRSQR